MDGMLLSKSSGGPFGVKNKTKQKNSYQIFMDVTNWMDTKFEKKNKRRRKIYSERREKINQKTKEKKWKL